MNTPETQITRARRNDLTPRGGKTEVTKRDTILFKALNYHGPLSVPYLLDYVKDDFPSTTVKALNYRLHVLSYYGEYRLDRPGQRFFRIGRNSFEVYGSSEAIDDYLLNSDLADRPAINLNAINFHHEMLLAHITASMELGAQRHDMEFIDEFEMLEHAPEGHTRMIPVEIIHDAEIWNKQHKAFGGVKRSSHKALKSDAYFGIKVDGRYCAFFVEADCGTEDLYTSNLEKNAWLPKILRYRKVIESGLYKKHLGIKYGAMVLIVTTKKSQYDGILEVIETVTKGKGSPYFLVKLWPDFDSRFFVPKEVNYSLFEDAWARSGHPPISLLS